MTKMKLCLIVADERITREYDNVVMSMDEAKERAKKMLETVDEEDLWDAYVEVFDFDEYIKCPEDNYTCFGYDADGVFCEYEMVMGTWARVRRELIGAA